jgi:hypothetical protein
MASTCAGWILLAGIVLGACGPAAGLERDEVARATLSVHAADEAGAREAPEAGYYLGIAERELDRALGQLRVHDAQGARGWARRAWADAEVARLLSIEAATRGAAQHTEDDAERILRARDAGTVGAMPGRGP